MLDAIIFDLDGTLGDTLPLCLACFHQAIGPLAGKPVSDQDILQTFGAAEQGTVQRLVPPELAEQGFRDYMRLYEELHAEYCPEPFPGIREILELLRVRNVFTGLVTGKCREGAVISMAQFGLNGFFQAREYGSVKGLRKTEALLDILKTHSLSAEKTAYVGDSPTDISGSRAAGLITIGAGWAPETNVDALRAENPDHLFLTVDEFARYVHEATEK